MLSGMFLLPVMGIWERSCSGGSKHKTGGG